MTLEKQVARRPQDYLPVPITKEQAMYLLKTIWPKAPEVEVIKAGILCQQYGLNPLMRQVYLIEFGKEWVTVLGIKATRQIAQQALKKRGIHYSYADGPRVMNEKEQEKIRGKIEPDKIWAITILQDSEGNKYPGYGFWPANKQPYGTDKGNDALNMAFIRSERNALDKLAPGELPDIEVGDDAYITVDYRIAIEKGKQQFHKQVEKDIKELWPDDGTEPSSSTSEKTQPAGKLEPTQETTKAQTSPATGGSSGNVQKDETLVTKEQLKHITELLEINKMGATDLGKWMVEKKWDIPKKMAEIKVWQYNEICQAFEQGKP